MELVKGTDTLAWANIHRHLDRSGGPAWPWPPAVNVPGPRQLCRLHCRLQDLHGRHRQGDGQGAGYCCPWWAAGNGETLFSQTLIVWIFLSCSRVSFSDHHYPNDWKLKQAADKIFDFEKNVALRMSPASDRRNSTAMYNPMTIAELKALMPNMDWDK